MKYNHRNQLNLESKWNTFVWPRVKPTNCKNTGKTNKLFILLFLLENSKSKWKIKIEKWRCFSGWLVFVLRDLMKISLICVLFAFGYLGFVVNMMLWSMVDEMFGSHFLHTFIHCLSCVCMYKQLWYPCSPRSDVSRDMCSFFNGIS